MMKKCLKHPKYKGKAKPPHCEACIKLFLSLKKLRIPIRYEKIVKSKKEYTRKEKHKKIY